MTAIDVTDASFETDVLERSDTTPVVIDLWAPWCGPCRTLGPIIEQAVDATGGAVSLTKVNVDENPRISATFQVQSIPAVFALYQRQVIDQFIGALPEHQVKAFVDRVREQAQPTEAQQLLAAGDEASLRKALELEPASTEVITALASFLVGRGEEADADEALGLLERIPETAETRRIAAIARTGGGAATLAGAKPAGGDGGPAAEGALEARLDALLAKVPGDEAARQEIVDLLETMDPADPRRDRYRRALSAKLF